MGRAGGTSRACRSGCTTRESRQWSLNFVSSASGTMSVPTVGAFKNGRGEFYDWEEFNGRMILVRNVWKDITPTSCRFEQSYSDDGGKTWELNWIATDTRIKNEPPPPTNDAPHDFDFEIGSWKVQNSRLLHPLTDSARWIHFEGTSVARKLWNGRGVLIELASDPPSGHSEGLILRTWNPQARQWNVAFAGSRGGSDEPTRDRRVQQRAGPSSTTWSSSTTAERCSPGASCPTSRRRRTAWSWRTPPMEGGPGRSTGSRRTRG